MQTNLRSLEIANSTKVKFINKRLMVDQKSDKNLADTFNRNVNES